MSDTGSSVTLILYSIDRSNVFHEPFLNLIAAAAQGSSFTHVEISLGEEAGVNGQMSNVLRIFNDDTGVELMERTGRNPSYSFLQIGCSKRAEAAMLQFARAQIGKPFSSTGMARALFWPRTPDNESWFCAELVAACLQAGGLLSRDSNPSAATPASLYRVYKGAATTGNPWALRAAVQNQHGLRNLPLAASTTSAASAASAALAAAHAHACARAQQARQAQQSHALLTATTVVGVPAPARSLRRPDSPPRAALKVVHAGAPATRAATLTLSLKSLEVKRNSR